MTNPIPLTADPSDPNSPKGAIPVTVHGIEGGGGADIDWTDIEAQDISLLGYHSLSLDGGNSVRLGVGLNSLNIDDVAGISLLSATSDVNIRVDSASRDIRFHYTVLVNGEPESHTITLRGILGKIDELEQRLEALENPED